MTNKETNQNEKVQGTARKQNLSPQAQIDVKGGSE
jgi:hypothetical protein